MDLEAVMVDMEAALATIDGLRVVTVGDKVVPPAAFVTFPLDIDFDVTYGRGEDHTELQAVVVIGRTVARETRRALAAYCAGSGSASVKAALESYTYTAAEVITVPHADFDVHNIAGVDYMAAIFTVNVAGQGA